MLFAKTPEFTVSIPSAPEDVDSIVYLARQTFGDMTIEPSTVRDAYRKNPYCNVIAKDLKDNVIGYMDFFLLKPETFKAYLEGRIGEDHFISADILEYGSADAQNQVYLGGLAAFSSVAHSRGRAVQVLLHGFARLMAEKYVEPFGAFNAYASGFSEEGIRMLERLDFQRIAEASTRSDEMPLYACKMDADYLTRMTHLYTSAEKLYSLNLN